MQGQGGFRWKSFRRCAGRSIHRRDLASYVRIKRVLQRFQPDVVHTHSAKAGILGRQAAWTLRVPAIVHTVHGATFHPYQGRAGRAFFRACERWAAGKCHALISVADAMTDLMVQSGVAPRRKFTTIYSGMEVEPFLQADGCRERIRRELGYSTEHVVIGKVARLFHLKGHADVIEAARRVVEVQPTSQFLFVGDGILGNRLRRQIADCGLESHFQFTGLVTPRRVAELLGAMDIVVHASLREGLARVLPQALIAGKPVVSYDVDGAREVVLSDVTGRLLKPRDIQGMANAICQLAAEPALRQRLGEEGRRRFTDVFRHQRMTCEIRAAYQRIIARGCS